MNTLLKRSPMDESHNSDLCRVIHERVKWDKRVSLADLDIVIQGDRVIVSGYVDTSYKKNAALEVIADTEGVWSIEDRIVVPADYYRTDEEIHQILSGQMDDIIKVGGEHIEIEVIDGVVKLEGEVFRPRLKAMAVACAWELSGVKDVLNYIEIVDPPRRMTKDLDFEVVETWPAVEEAKAEDY